MGVRRHPPNFEVMIDSIYFWRPPNFTNFFAIMMTTNNNNVSTSSSSESETLGHANVYEATSIPSINTNPFACSTIITPCNNCGVPLKPNFTDYRCDDCIREDKLVMKLHNLGLNDQDTEECPICESLVSPFHLKNGMCLACAIETEAGRYGPKILSSEIEFFRCAMCQQFFKPSSTWAKRCDYCASHRIKSKLRQRKPTKYAALALSDLDKLVAEKLNEKKKIMQNKPPHKDQLFSSPQKLVATVESEVQHPRKFDFDYNYVYKAFRYQNKFKIRYLILRLFSELKFDVRSHLVDKRSEPYYKFFIHLNLTCSGDITYQKFYFVTYNSFVALKQGQYVITIGCFPKCLSKYFKYYPTYDSAVKAVENNFTVKPELYPDVYIKPTDRTYYACMMVDDDDDIDPDIQASLEHQSVLIHELERKQSEAAQKMNEATLAYARAEKAARKEAANVAYAAAREKEAKAAESAAFQQAQSENKDSVKSSYFGSFVEKIKNTLNAPANVAALSKTAATTSDDIKQTLRKVDPILDSLVSASKDVPSLVKSMDGTVKNADDLISQLKAKFLHVPKFTDVFSQIYDGFKNTVHAVLTIGPLVNCCAIVALVLCYGMSTDPKIKKIVLFAIATWLGVYTLAGVAQLSCNYVEYRNSLAHSLLNTKLPDGTKDFTLARGPPDAHGISTYRKDGCDKPLDLLDFDYLDSERDQDIDGKPVTPDTSYTACALDETTLPSASALFMRVFSWLGATIVDGPISWFDTFFHHTDKRMKQMITLFTFTSKFQDFISYLQQAFEWVVDSVYVYVYGIPRSLKVDDLGKLFSVWMHIKANPTCYSPAVYECVRSGFHHYAKQVTKISDPKVANVLSNALTEVTTAQNKIMGQYFSSRKGCVPPLVVQITGEPGLGKSTAIIALAKALCCALLGGVDYESIHTRNSALDFWDNYRNELICIFDDWGQFVDVEGTPSADFMELIKIKNIAQYLLAMADLKDKGMFVFTSQIVLLTSNKDLTDTLMKSLTCPGALKRRLDIILTLVSQDRYELVKLFDKDYRDEQNRREVRPTYDSSTLAPFLLQEYYKYCAREVAVSKKITAKFIDSVAGYSPKNDWLNADALDHYLKVTKFLNVDSLTPREIETLSKVGAHFTKIKNNDLFEIPTSVTGYGKGMEFTTLDHLSRSIIEDLFEIKLPALATPTPDDISQFFGWPREKIEVFPVNWTNLDLYTQTPRMFDILKTNLINMKGSSGKFHPNHCCEICNHLVVQNHDGEKCVQRMRQYMDGNEEYMNMKIDIYSDADIQSDPLPLCPLHIATMNKIPRYELFDPSANTEVNPKMMAIMIRGYDCDCLKDSPCSKTHTWSFKDVNVAVKRLFAASLTFSVPDQIFPNMRQHIKQMRIEQAPKCRSPLQWFKDMYAKIPDGAIRTGSIIAGFIGVIGLGVTLATLAGMGKLGTKEKPNAQMEAAEILNSPIIDKPILHAAVSNPPQARKARTRAIRNVLSKGGYSPCVFGDLDGTADTVAKDLIYVITKQMVRLKKNGNHAMNGLMISCNDILTSAHLRLVMQPDDVITLHFPFRGAAFNGLDFLWKELTIELIHDGANEPTLDAMIIRLPSKMFIPHCSTLTKKFVSADGFAKLNGKRCLLSVLEGRDEIVPNQWSIQDLNLFTERVAYDIKHNGVVHMVETPVCLEFAFLGEKGNCGSPLTLVDHNLGHGARIIGVFSATSSSANSSIAAPVCYEAIVDCLSRLDISSKQRQVRYQENIPLTYAGAMEFIEDDGSCYAVGSNQKPADLNFYGGRIPTHVNAVSHIIPSRIQENKHFTLPIYKDPARLKPFTNEAGEVVDPANLALNKFCTRIYRMCPDLIKAALTDLESVYAANHKSHHSGQRRILTIEEAVFGIEGNDFYPPINLATSAGQWWKRSHPGKGKKHLIDPERRWIHPDLYKAVLQRILYATNGDNFEAIFEDHMKDEKREAQKAKAGKTRLFSAGPIDLTIVMRMYFGAFVAWFLENRIDNESSIGINPTSPEWDKLARFIKKYGDSVIAGDFGNFDATLIRELLMAILDIINNWYHDDFSLIRSVIWESVIGALHFNNGRFYDVFGCNPSGNALTAIINTIYNCLFFRCVYYASAKDHKVDVTQYPFSEFVAFNAFGDDNLCGVSPQVQYFFNPNIVTAYASSLGMTYTDESKGDKNTEFRRLTQVMYLKRGFVWDDGEMLHLAPLHWPTLIDIPNWTWDDIDRDDLPASCEQVLRELALWDEKTFDHWSHIVLKAAEEAKYPRLNSCTYRAYRDSMLRGGGYDTSSVELFV